MKAIQLHRDLTRIWEGEPGWRGVLTSVSHTDLGKRFITVFRVVAGNGDHAVVVDFDHRAGRFLQRTDVLATRADKHPDFFRVDLGPQQSRCPARDIFFWLGNGRQHKPENLHSRFPRLCQCGPDDFHDVVAISAGSISDPLEQ